MKKKVIRVVASLLLASYSTTLTLICSHTWEAVEESQQGITLSLRCRWKQSLFIGLCESLSFTSPLVETCCQSPIAMQAGSPQERPRQVLKQYVSVFVREWVCVRQWQKDWTCLFWFGCLSKSKIFSSFPPLQRMNITSSVDSLEVVFPADFTPLLTLARETKQPAYIWIFGKEETGYEWVIWKHLWPQSLLSFLLHASTTPTNVNAMLSLIWITMVTEPTAKTYKQQRSGWRSVSIFHNNHRVSQVCVNQGWTWWWKHLS